MGIKLVLGTLVAGVAIGGVAFPSHEVPHTKVVTVRLPPKIIAAPEKEVPTKIVTKPLPDSCESFIDETQYVEDAANRVHNRATAMFTKVQYSVAGASLQQWLQDHENANSDDLHTLFEYNKRLADQLATCRSDIKKSNAGGTVRPADGVPEQRVY